MYVRDKSDFHENWLTDSYFWDASESKYVSSRHFHVYWPKWVKFGTERLHRRNAGIN